MFEWETERNVYLRTVLYMEQGGYYERKTMEQRNK